MAYTFPKEVKITGTYTDVESLETNDSITPITSNSGADVNTKVHGGYAKQTTIRLTIKTKPNAGDVGGAIVDACTAKYSGADEQSDDTVTLGKLLITNVQRVQSHGQAASYVIEAIKVP